MIDNCRLSVTDQAGNINNISINIVHVHNYTQEITKTATCTEDGIITYSCACGDTYTEPIPASGDHNFVDNICSICGKNEYEDFELNWATISKTGLISLNDGTFISNNVTIPDIFEFDRIKYKTTSINLYYNRFDEASNVTSLILPNTITEINSLTAFHNSESIIIPESVKKLGRSIIMPGANMKTIYINSIFDETNLPFQYYDTNLSYGYKLVIGEKITSLQYLFCNNSTTSTQGDHSIKEIEIRGSVSIIPRRLFSLLINMEKITLPNKIETIESDAFTSCINLVTINIPDSIKRIESMAFYNCKKLSLNIPNTIESIEEDAFRGVAHIYYNGNLTSNNNWGALDMN